MLKEALEYIHDTAHDEAEVREPKKLDFLLDNRKVHYSHNGEVRSFDIPPPLRGHKVDSVHDLIAATKKWGEHGTIWVSSECVTLVIDDIDRRERITLPLHKTTVFAVVERLSTEPKMDQANFIRLLRREFRTSPQQATILAAARKIKFRTATTGYGNVEHGNESMGKEIEAAVSGVGGDIPDSLMLPLCVYSNPGESSNKAIVAFDLEIDVHQQRFVLKPMPDEVKHVVDQSLADIRKRIMEGVGKEVPVLFGTP